MKNRRLSGLDCGSPPVFVFFENFFFFFRKHLAYVKKNNEYCARFALSVASYLRIVIRMCST